MGTVITVLLGALAIGVAWVISGNMRTGARGPVRWGGTVMGSLMIGLGIFSSSFIIVGEDETYHYVRKFAGPSMPDGQIIALRGQQGPSAEIWGPGFHVVPLMGLFGDFQALPVVGVPDGHFGVLVAVDGAPLSEDAVAASPLPGTSIAASLSESAPTAPDGTNVLDAALFLTPVSQDGFGGQKGLQSTVLRPGRHRINLFLFSVRITDSQGQTIGYYNRNGYSENRTINTTPTTVTEVPTGYVGVVRANIDEGWADCNQTTQVSQGELQATLVPVGCKGVWDEALRPGSYFINQSVYDVTLIDTRAQRFEYRGGYRKCDIPLSVESDGSITQERRCESTERQVPPGAADGAITVVSEGWEIPVELRVLGQVTADQAPAIVAAVGDLQQVEDRIITPMIRSAVRNIGGGQLYAPVYDETGNALMQTSTDPDTGEVTEGAPLYAYRPTRALDFYQNREALEAEFSRAILGASGTGGINIFEVRMGEPAVPPELLIAQQRNQLAQQLQVTFAQEQEAQRARIEAEELRAQADQQATLVAAQIDRQAQEERGEGRRAYLEAVARGQRAQTAVLGEDATERLQALQMQLDFVGQLFTDNPDLLANIPMPNTLLVDGSDLENAAGIFGSMGGQLPSRDER